MGIIAKRKINYEGHEKYCSGILQQGAGYRSGFTLAFVRRAHCLQAAHSPSLDMVRAVCVGVWVCRCVRVLSCVWLFVTPCTVAHQAPLSIEFSRQEYWSGLPLLSPGDQSHFACISSIARQVLYQLNHQGSPDESSNVGLFQQALGLL